MSSPAHVRRAKATTVAARRQAGRTGPFSISAYVPVAIGRDAAAARRSVRPIIARYLAHLHGQTIVAEAGVSPDQSLAIREARARGESGAGLVTEEQVDTFTLAGAPDQVREALGAWLREGLDTPIALPVGDDPIEQMKLIAAELGPCIAGRA
jgi:alkanesulfonate monooxygenase SsuD/methylene tetrahydromethanopterin reductase-like flavin-dependent oxidoreductase (luciferase family)